MTPTLDQLFSAGANSQPYTIDQILAGVQGQYTSRPQYQSNMTIDDILAGLAKVPQQATPYETGAQRFVGEVAPSAEYFKPAEFDAEKYRMVYENAADKAQRVYNETYADQIAAGKSQAQAQKEAAENAQFWGTLGSLGGSYFGPGGGIIGGMVDSKLAEPLDDLTEGISDIFGW